MKSHGLLVALAAVFVVSALFTLALGVRYAWAIRDVQTLQTKASLANYHRNVIQGLATEASEYGKRNPKILPVLETAAARQKAQKSAPTGKAPGK